ncbi:AAA family ATPase [Vibrio sp. WXL103]|uniref:AAA family ATPase n=1 Tax=Vibrio sp. WXL103 TaxID=3450710 RepID=UPI003EC57128
MIQVYFVCGFIGSGKSTLSNKLATEHSGFIFSPDEWMIPLFGEHMEREVFDRRLNTLRELFDRSALRMVQLGVPVIFDYGFWSKREREQAVEWAQSHQLDFEFIYLGVDYEVCRARALLRNTKEGMTCYQMSDEMLELFWSKFEPPVDEPYITMYQGEGMLK